MEARAGDLEQQLEELLEVERFAPSGTSARTHN